MVVGPLKQLGCFFQTQASGRSSWSGGQVGGSPMLLAFILQEERICLLGVRVEGPFGSLTGVGFCSFSHKCSAAMGSDLKQRHLETEVASSGR